MSTYAEELHVVELEPVRDKLARVLVDDWQEEDRLAGPKPMANPRKPIRHSWAGKCARQMAYLMLGREPGPMDKEGIWVTRLGTEVHEKWQDALATSYPHWQMEVPAETAISSGSADAWNPHLGVVAELKTINGFGYKRVITSGPRLSNLLQLAVNAHALSAKEGRLTYLPMEVNRRGPQDLSIGATYVIDRPLINILSEFELKRWDRIIKTLDRGYLPPRQVIDSDLIQGAEVADPMSGKLDVGGKTWQCGYCSFQLSCMSDGKGAVKLPDRKSGVDDLWA